ncbi:selenoprotein f [Holotrichia oblita]|uniref:Selenoprotein f n=1 Tax=Holotrichia oblita TaxID=644536 RepID=A0ACB9T222_HOLOL|nr:selenoprotein f [Holotrichia oblita]
MDNNELTDMLQVFFECNKNRLEAVRRCSVRFPDREIPDSKIFQRIETNLRNYGSFKKPNTQKRKFSEDKELNVLLAVQENSQTSTREIAHNIGVSKTTVHAYCLCDEIEENVDENETEEFDRSKYFRAQVESCPGCSLNRLKDVKTFVYEDVPKYDRVTFKKINGAPPELVFFDKDDNVVERVDLRSLDREQCNYQLLKRGFLLKLAARSPVNKDEL